MIGLQFVAHPYRLPHGTVDHAGVACARGELAVDVCYRSDLCRWSIHRTRNDGGGKYGQREAGSETPIHLSTLAVPLVDQTLPFGVHGSPHIVGGFGARFMTRADRLQQRLDAVIGRLRFYASRRHTRSFAAVATTAAGDEIQIAIVNLVAYSRSAQRRVIEIVVTDGGVRLGT